MATKKATTSTKSKAKKEIAHEDVQKRAQEIYAERIKKNSPGDELSDWVQAEKELNKK